MSGTEQADIERLLWHDRKLIEKDAEIERLRELLREGADGIENSIQSPACMDWMRRVREALDE